MKDIHYYLSLKYPIELIETDEGFVAAHPDLAGCASFGDTAAEAIDSLKDVRELWLKGQVEANGVAPEPRAEEEFSGRFVVRLPKWLHRLLDAEAKRQSSSLNTFVVSLLSLGLRPRVTPGEPGEASKVEEKKGWTDVWADEAGWYIDAQRWSPLKGDIADHFRLFTHTRHHGSRHIDELGAECHGSRAKAKDPN
jgi:antitoxin HicB